MMGVKSEAVTGWGRAMFVPTIGLLVVATWATVHSIPVHHDIGWPIWVAQQVLGGKSLYRDVVEVHPPLIVGVAMAAVLAGRASGLTPILAYHLIALLTVLVSLGLCWRVLGAILGPDRPATRMQALLVIAFVQLPFVGYAFGLEEHFMLALVLPYLLLLGALAGGHEIPGGSRLLIGLLAGLGFAMKPFYGPVWLVLVGTLILVRGRGQATRTETVAPAVVMASYVALTLVFAPGYYRIARLAAALYYDYFPTPLHLVFLSTGMVAALVALLAHIGVRKGPLFGPLRRVLVVALAGFVLVVFAQRKGWSYHWYPVFAVSLLIVHSALLDLLSRRRAPSRAGVAPATLAIAGTAALVLAFGGWRLDWSRTFWGDLSGSPYYLPQMERVVQRFGDGGPIVAYSTAMPVGFPLINYSGVRWASRFSCLWMIPGLYVDRAGPDQPFSYRDPERMGSFERYVIDAVATDLGRERPSLVIVDQAPPSSRIPEFRYLDYFARDPRFADLFRDYVLIGTVGRYQIFKRNPDRPGDPAG